MGEVCDNAQRRRNCKVPRHPRRVSARATLLAAGMHACTHRPSTPDTAVSDVSLSVPSRGTADVVKSDRGCWEAQRASSGSARMVGRMGMMVAIDPRARVSCLWVEKQTGHALDTTHVCAGACAPTKIPIPPRLRQRPRPLGRVFEGGHGARAAVWRGVRGAFRRFDARVGVSGVSRRGRSGCGRGWWGARAPQLVPALPRDPVLQGQAGGKT